METQGQPTAQTAIIATGPATDGASELTTALGDMSNVQVPAVESPEQVKEEPAAQNEMSFAELAKKEKQLRHVQKTLKEKERSFKEFENKMTAKLQELEAKLSGTKLPEDPFQYLEQKGMTLADLNELALNNGTLNEKMLIKQLQKKIEEIESGQKETLTAFEQRLAEEKQRESDGKLQAYKSELSRYFTDNQEKYKLSTALKANDPDVLTDAAIEIYQKTGKAPTFSQLADWAEDVAKNQLNDILQLESTKDYVLSFYKLKAETPPSNPTRDTPITKTITNRSTESSAPSRLLPREESLRRLAVKAQALIDSKNKENS